MKRMVRLMFCIACLSALVLPVLRADSPSDPNCSACFADLVEQYSGRGWIGVTFHRHGPREGLEVLEIAPEGPAARTSLRSGDVVVSLGGRNTRDAETAAEIEAILAGIEPGELIGLVVERSGERLTLELRPRPLPREILVQLLGQHVLRYGESRRDFRSARTEKPPGG
jgi:membrane-associated protease RseP (regulator of RpoE activity)